MTNYLKLLLTAGPGRAETRLPLPAVSAPPMEGDLPASPLPIEAEGAAEPRRSQMIPPAPAAAEAIAKSLDHAAFSHSTHTYSAGSAAFSEAAPRAGAGAGALTRPPISAADLPPDMAVMTRQGGWNSGAAGSQVVFSAGIGGSGGTAYAPAPSFPSGIANGGETGPGLEAEALSRIFEKDARRHDKGGSL
ncbi:hypothetical protein LJC32_04945 [Oscillospiraceae bacterium OttesenSCG-928-F05]|nr:hypothetical protein [Oscillospiraceae bacterium OttesenSCG-928-F05]